MRRVCWCVLAGIIFSVHIAVAGDPVLTLQECEEQALAQNHRRPASAFAVAAAEARHRKVLSGYWPQLTVQGGFTRLDDKMNFLFPAQMMNVAGVTMPVAEYEVELFDEDSWTATAQAAWLLFDGGMRKGLRMQTAAGLQIAREDARRTDLEVLDSVRRLYAGAVMAQQLYQVGVDTLARMEATLGLTETMYKEGSRLVKKTDYLSNLVMVETLRSAVATLEKNVLLSRAALANTMGLGWEASVQPAATEIPFQPCDLELDDAVGEAYVFSPDWLSLEAAQQAAAGRVKEAKSDYYPRVAVQGRVHKWWNDFEDGLATDENKEGWSFGFGIELPLFEGFMTQNNVKEARARKGELAEQQLLLKEGLGLQIRSALLDVSASEKQFEATKLAMETSTENRELNMRAYQNDLVETEDVITAQLTEAFMMVQHYKVRYDHAAQLSRLNLVIGREIMKQWSE